jgi:hypothetical protein
MGVTWQRGLSALFALMLLLVLKVLVRVLVPAVAYTLPSTGPLG